MKKSIFKLLISTGLLFNLVTVKATDTASNSGYGCILTGTIYDSYINARVTGTDSSNYNVELKYAYYINTAGVRKKANDTSNMSYINYYGSSCDSNFFKWLQVTVSAKNSNTGYKITLRTLYN